MNHVSTGSLAPLRRMLAALFFVAGVLFAPRVALAGGTIDQTGPYTGISIGFGLGSTFQQQIKVGIAGQLVGISIESPGPLGNTLNVVIRRGATWSTQPALFQQLVTKTGAASTILIDTTAAPLFFAVGEVFVLEIQGTATSLNLGASQVAPPGQPLYPEPFFWNSNPYSAGVRLAFTTYVGPCTTNAQCDDQNVCTTDSCNLGTGLCSHANNTLSCDDGNGCTQNDVCKAGTCAPGAAVTCPALDGCHDVGVCNPMSGVCSTPTKPNGSACNDTNACTQTDTCQNGVCTGQSPVVCPAPDACHTAGTCNMATGMCSNPAKADGTACNDSNACTPTDVCQAGVCTGQNPVVCTASDTCHSIGLCDTVTGKCSNPAKPNGSTCDDGNGCTQTDTCQAGACTGQNPVVCAPASDCQTAGVCDPTSGACNNTQKPDGTTCDDGTACTQSDTCQSGSCLGGTTVVCAALDACHDIGTCDAKSGLCSNPTKAEGASCDDGTACTQGDTCVSGTCTSGPPVVCAALDKCHDAGTCDAATGQCSNPLKPLDCSANSVCEQDGVCNPATGACVNAAKPDGVPCGKGVCVAGTCSDEAGNTTSGGTSTTGSASTGTGASTGVGGAGAGGAGAGGASGGTGVGGASSGTGVGGSSATGISGPGATSTGSGEGPVTPAGGCGCSTPGTSPARAPWLLLGLLLPALRRRRKAPRLAA